MFWPKAINNVNAVTTVPAPVGGLNARDSLAAMPPTDAIVMSNWWPQPYGCLVRKGTRKWSTGLDGEVQSLWPWSGILGEQKLFGFAGGKMYDCTVQGPVGAPLLDSLSNSIWDGVQLTNISGNHLILVNGVDDGIMYDELGVSRIVAGDGTGQTWGGIDPKLAVQATVHQSRLWVVEKDSAVGWYFPILSQYGLAKKWDFGPLFQRGGYLQYLTTWTLDDGNGAEDHLLAMSSRGEVVVYSGGNPEDFETAFQLVGVYYVGSPVSGRRGFAKAAGDQLVLTQQGVVSMTSKLISTKVDRAEDAINSLKIQYLISELINDFVALFGWEIQYFPKFNMVIVNVPSVVAGGNIQLAANQITGAWTQFANMDAICWASFGSGPYYGSYNGVVYRAWDGTLDGVETDGTGGTGIVARVQQAFNYYDNLATQKQISMYRPTFVVTAPITYNTKILYDFATEQITTPGAPAKKFDSLWNYALWDTAKWGGGTSIQKFWIQAEGIGVAASLRMATQTESEVLWVSTDYSLINGKGLF